MLYLMSTTIIPSGADGTWKVSTISLQQAISLLQETPCPTSAVGHASTAEAMSELLGQEVKMNRLTVHPQVGDVFLCFKLNKRPPEGAILDREALDLLEYSWCFMHYVSAD